MSRVLPTQVPTGANPPSGALSGYKLPPVFSVLVYLKLKFPVLIFLIFPAAIARELPLAAAPTCIVDRKQHANWEGNRGGGTIGPIFS